MLDDGEDTKMTWSQVDKGPSLYHYTESGLDNIFLVDGFTISETDYGKTVSIQETEDLHEQIGRGIVDSPAFITGAEFRFLRLEMDLSQRQLAGLINVDEQAVRRWEKARDKGVRGAAERMIRILYMQFVNDPAIRQKIERLAELDVLAHSPKMVLKKPPGSHWVAEDCLAT
jgi:putative transcriptional regulator